MKARMTSPVMIFPQAPVPDEVWAEAAQHYDEHGLARVLLSIVLINVWNRLNVATSRRRASG